MNKVKTNLFALAAGVLISPALMAADVDTPSQKAFSPYRDCHLYTLGKRQRFAFLPVGVRFLRQESFELNPLTR